MSDFENAQKLFGEYEKSSSLDKLKESLDILTSLIEENGPDSQRAIKFNARARNVLESQIRKMVEKYNIKDFAKSFAGTQSNEVLAEIFSVMSPEDAEYCFHLVMIAIDRE